MVFLAVKYRHTSSIKALNYRYFSFIVRGKKIRYYFLLKGSCHILFFRQNKIIKNPQYECHNNFPICLHNLQKKTHLTQIFGDLIYLVKTSVIVRQPSAWIVDDITRGSALERKAVKYNYILWRFFCFGARIKLIFRYGTSLRSIRLQSGKKIPLYT